MAVIRFAGFAGENRAVEPKLLGDSVLTLSRNQKPGRGDLRSWRTPLQVATVPTGAKTIYRMGRDVASDSSYWLSWQTVVHAVRGFNADDTTEQTFYTGDGAPKFTNNILALASTPYPTGNRPMGLPAPLTALTVQAQAITVADVGKYKYNVTAAEIASLKVGDTLRVNTNDTTALVVLTSGAVSGTVSAASLASQLNAVNGISATVSSDTTGVDILSDTVNDKFTIEKKTGTTDSYETGTATLTDYLHGTASTTTTYSGGTIGSTIGASSMIAGHTYRINSVGTTDFTAYGAPNNNALTIFVATGAATGTGTVDNITSPSSNTSYVCEVTITATMIQAMAVNQHFSVAVNSDAASMVTVAEGFGTYPSAVTADTVRNAFAGATGVTATIVTDQTTGARSVKVSPTTVLSGSVIDIKKITPGQTDNFTEVVQGTQITVDATTDISVFYVYTYVNDFGWESAPSPVSAESARNAEATALLGGFAAPPSGNYNITTIRIYKTQTGSSSSDFYFLTEIGVGTASVTDTNGNLGDLLETTTWLPAPGVPTGGILDTTEPNLGGLVAMWNGMLAGISGNAVRVCEPYVPYAWPKAYEVVPPDSKPIGLGVFGQNLLILTTGRPVLVNGSGPDGLDQQKIEMPQACVSPQSIVSMGAGVAWASEDGLCWFGSSGARILTAGLMLREDWQAMNPRSIIGCMYEGLYLGSYLDGNDSRAVRRGFLIDPSSPTGIYFLDTGYETMHFDELRDHLYVLDESTKVKKWDSSYGEGLSYFTYNVRSKVFKQPYPQNYGAAEVVASGYPVTFRLIADGTQVFETSVQSRAPFRLPGGFRAFDYQIELAGTQPVQGVAIATAMQELSEV